MSEDFCIVDPPCEWCGGKVKIVSVPQNDSRIHLSLFICIKCKKVQAGLSSFTYEFPREEIQKVLDKFSEKYGF